METIDRKKLHDEFGSHFKNSPDELGFLETFIDDLIGNKDREFSDGYQVDLLRINKSLNKSCEDKVKEEKEAGERKAKELLRLQIIVIKKILVAYAFMEKPVSITKLFKQIDKL